jgi:hypothetical protein
LGVDVPTLICGSIRTGSRLSDVGAGAKKFKVDPQRLLYSLQWKHNGTPPDFHLQLATEPALWFEFVATLLLGALSKHEPGLRDRLRAAVPA